MLKFSKMFHVLTEMSIGKIKTLLLSVCSASQFCILNKISKRSHRITKVTQFQFLCLYSQHVIFTSDLLFKHSIVYYHRVGDTLHPPSKKKTISNDSEPLQTYS